MGQIYEHAWLTIIAAHGHNADADLPGIESNSREPRTLVREIKAVDLHWDVHKRETSPRNDSLRYESMDASSRLPASGHSN